MLRPVLFGLLLAAQVSSPQCGATSPASPSAAGTVPSASNAVPIVVNGGPANNALNEAFVSVTVCVPGTSNCQTIDGIQVDTGSSGLRILSSRLTLPLTQQTNNGSATVECLAFLDGVAWGPVVTADVRVAGEQASSIPIQVVGTDQFSSIPGDCSAQGPPEETVDDFGANGLLGIGFLKEDCGLGCAVTGSSNYGQYYACPATGACQVTAIQTANQVVNPVARFSTDNNGSVIQLPVAQAGGLPSLTGALVFGIGTQSNNGLGSATVLTVDGAYYIRTGFNGQTYTRSFIDSGSNAIFFPETAGTGMPACKNSIGFYCPPTLRPFSATLTGGNGASAVVAFSAGNVDNLNATFAVMGEATGSGPLDSQFDWGLPFFYGRTVFTAIEGQATPGGIGPYWAY